MKHSILSKQFSIIAALLLMGSLSAQTPKNVTRLEKNIYIDNNEVSIQSWNEYVWWNLNKYGAESERYLSALPDTAAFRQIYGHTYILPRTPFSKEDGLFQEEYDAHPMVGVSYRQARDFCSWRTMMWNALPSHKSNVIFALPSDADLSQAAAYKKVHGLNDDDKEYTTFIPTATTGQFRCLTLIPETPAQRAYARYTAHDDWNISLLVDYRIDTQSVEAIILSPTDAASWDTLSRLFLHIDKSVTTSAKNKRDATICLRDLEDPTIAVKEPTAQEGVCLVVSDKSNQTIGLFFLKSFDQFQPLTQQILDAILRQDLDLKQLPASE